MINDNFNDSIVPQARLKTAGFTLIEVLMALLIFSIVSLSITATVNQVVLNADALERNRLARWVAEDAQAELLLGLSDSSALSQNRSLGGIDWQIRFEVSPVPANALTDDMQRLEIKVSSQDEPDRVLYQLAMLMRTPS